MKRARRSGAAASGKAARLLERAAAAERAGALAAAEADYRKLLENAPRHPQASLRLGMLYARNGRAQAALPHLERAAALQPRNADLLNALGLLHSQLAGGGAGGTEAAEARFRAALKASPRHPQASANLADLLHGRGRHGEAIEYFEAALRSGPDWLGGRLRLALSLVAVGEVERARQGLEQILLDHPDDLDALADVGAAFRLLGDAARARTLFEQAHGLAPEDPQILDSLGLALVDAGDMQGAERHFVAALRRAPRSASTWYNRVRVRRFGVDDAGEIGRLEALADDPAAPTADRALLGFALGKVHGDLGDVDRAFAHYAQANALQRRLVPFDAQAQSEWFGRIQRTFDGTLFQNLSGSGVDCSLPVLVIGMPRSGTTLVEQILASHPGVHGAGELRELPAAAQRLGRAAAGAGTGYPECVADAGVARLTELGARYVQRLQVLGGDALRVTDKLPTNFQHLGLAALMLRGVHIVHCRRDPMDTCLSNFIQYFAEGHGYAYGLESTAQMFAHYHRLMAHWRAVLPVPILDLDYEALVADVEGQVRRLLAHLGLDFDARCLRFHESRRRVDTASNWQVRQPIYSDATGRWKRFERHLVPLREALGRELPDLDID